MNLEFRKKSAFLIVLIVLVLLFAMVSPSFVADDKKPKKDKDRTVNGYEWDKSSISIDGECVDDPDLEAIFYITNTGDPGDGDMDGPTYYYVYINDILEEIEEFQLDGGEILTVTVESGCDDSIRLEADQRPGHPGNGHPRFTISFADCACEEVD